VTREDVADGMGISRKLAAFHLEKLVTVGLLRVQVEPSAGRGRVGRRPKVYELSGVDLQIAVPHRQHDLLASILLEAMLSDLPETDVRSAAHRIAHEYGLRVGAAERCRVRPGRLGVERALSLAESLLQRYGFEPGRDAPTAVRLRNCPFHPIVARAPALVCALNHAFVTGLLDGLEACRAQATLAPRAGECCVEVLPRG